jgi:hypothetical protein
VGQSGNFPSAIKAVAEWFPKKDRALAVGIFNGGANRSCCNNKNGSNINIVLLILKNINYEQRN